MAKKERPRMTARLPTVRDVAPDPEALRRLAGDAKTENRTPSTVKGEGGAGWEGSHKRVTFYCPADVLEAVKTHTSDTPRGDKPTRSAFIVAALRAYLARPEGNDGP